MPDITGPKPVSPAKIAARESPHVPTMCAALVKAMKEHDLPEAIPC